MPPTFSFVLIDLATELDAQGLAVFDAPDASIFLGRLPASPTRAIALFEEAGVPTVTAAGVVQWETADVVVAVRDVDYAAARLWAEQIYQALLRLANRTIGPEHTFYLTAGVRTTPYYDGMDGRYPVIAFQCAPEKALSPEAWS